MNFTDWLQAHRRSILFLLLALAVAGVIAAFRLPVSLFPTVDFPRVVVSLDAGDRPADLMALQVTTPVEEAVRSVPGVRDVRSTTSRGSADISINFDWGTDMASATLQINAAVGPCPAATSAGNLIHHPAHGPDCVPHNRLQPHLADSFPDRTP